MKRLSLIAPILAVVFSLLAAAPSAAAGTSLTTPEEAIAAYIGGVAEGDLGAVLAATAADEMSANFDFDAYIGRIRALSLGAPAPTTGPFFVAINRAAFAAQFARQVQFLAYGLLTTGPILEGRTVPMDPSEAAQFESDLDAGKLAGLALKGVAVPNQTVMDSDRYRATAKKIAAVYGADDSTERVALIALGDRYYVIGFSLLRYGDQWRISAQNSPIAGTNILGVPTPISPDDFSKMVK